MRNFKAIITTNKNEQVGLHQKKIIINCPCDLKIAIDKNNQITDMKPRVFNGIDLFSKYHGRTSDWYKELISEIKIIYHETKI